MKPARSMVNQHDSIEGVPVLQFRKFLAISAMTALAFSVLSGCSSNSSNVLKASPVAPVITWSPASLVAGSTLSSAQLNATAAAPGGTSPLAGLFYYTPATGTAENTVGPVTLSVTFVPADLVDFNTVTASVTLNVAVTPAPQYTFTPVRIVGGGYVPGIVMHPTQKGLMYARTDVGGAYRWDPVNLIWIPITDFVNRSMPNASGIESIGLDPNDPQRLYMAAGLYTESYGGVCDLFLSSNQGATFTILPQTFKCGANDNGRGAGERLSVDPNLGTRVLWGTRQNGLWQSTDRGMTWAQLTSFPVTGTTSGVGVVFEIFLPASSSSGSLTKTIYAGVSATGTGADPSSLYVSNNAGVTWSAVPGAPTGLYVSHGALGADGNLYFSFANGIGPAGVTAGNIFQYVVPTTSNPNGTWNDITPPRTSGYQGGYGAVALDPEKPGVIMVSTLDHYTSPGDDLWRSLNYGKTWYSINTVGANRNDCLSPWLLFSATVTPCTTTSATAGTGNWVTALQIDPFNSDHVVHGTGGTIESSSNMTASDTGTASNWTIGALGIEETVITGLISPPYGPANLFSVMGDLDGFQHTSLTISPAGGMFQTPAETTGTSIDFAQAMPSIMARVGTGNSSKQFGGYSNNTGTSWTAFSTLPTGTVAGGGTIAVSANGSTIVWEPGDTGATTSYAKSSGTTWTAWTACTGAPANLPVYADRINPNVFYIYDAINGVLYASTNAGATFTATMNNVPKNGTLNVSYDAQGSLWLVSSQGLYHATNGATSFTQINSVTSGYSISEGKAQYASNYLTLYLGGTVGGVLGVFRSIDNGNTWFRVDDAAHGYGYMQFVQGDPRVFGRVYLGTGGRGIITADSPY
jgi:hypothetical protein